MSTELSRLQGVINGMRKRNKELEKALANLVEVIEDNDLMPPSLSYFAEAKKVLAKKAKK